MDENKLQQPQEEELSLDAIMKEFSDQVEDPDIPPEGVKLSEDTLVLEPLGEVPAQSPVSGDTVVMEPLTDTAGEQPSASFESTVTDDTVVLEEMPAHATEDTVVLEESLTAPQSAMTEDTVVMDPGQIRQAMREGASVTGDTIRLDTAEFVKGEVRNAQPIEQEDVPAQPQEQEAFTDSWEPEYEQPMGDYVPPQPIIVHPRSRARELKRKLVAGPEKRYYSLVEVGVGRLQLCMLMCLLTVIGAVALAIAHNNDSFGEDRLRFVIFAQLFLMLVAALLGSFQMIEGVADMCKKRFTLNSLLTVSFVVCCLDAALCLQELRVPCCAVFCLEMFMSMWATYHRRTTEMGMMDTMRRAVRLDKVCAYPDYHEGKTGLLRTYGQVEDLMDNYQTPSGPEKVQGWYALAALCVSLCIGVYGYIAYGFSQAVSLLSISILAAVPATAFISLTRPFAVLEKRLHALGTVICGWRGVSGVCGKAVFPMTHSDLFPAGCAKMNGVKFFGTRDPDEVVAYCTALVNADGGGLAPLFNQVLDSRNGRHYDVENLRTYEGGIGGEVCGEPVLVGMLSFLQQMGVETPEGIRVDRAVCVAIDGELCGLFAVTYEKARATAASLGTLCSYRKLTPMLVDGDFMLTENFLRARFGINPKRLQIPDYALARELKEKKVTEDAPGLIMTTKEGIAPIAFGITGARALRTASRLGLLVHIFGGAVGMAIVLVMALVNGLEYLSPVNMFLYHLVWMVPGWLITNWTKEI